MKKFLQWLKESNSNITIDLSALKEVYKKLAEDLVDSIERRQQQVTSFKPADYINKMQTTFSDYPLIKNLISALNSKNINYIYNQYGKFRIWLQKQPYDANKTTLARQTYTYFDVIEKKEQENPNYVYEEVKKLLVTSEQNMQTVKSTIEQAISRISNWNGSPIIIEALDAQDERGPILQAADDAHIILGNDEYAPNFTLFNHDGKYVTEDVLEGGDTDFFKDHKIQADYFNLINEINKPGSTNKGKILTLYTARPKEDRNHYINATTLPANIFLTNDYSHAEGLAIDLAGSKEPRDIWKVRIDSRYLTQTLDGPVKYYQVTVPDAPAKIELL